MTSAPRAAVRVAAVLACLWLISGLWAPQASAHAVLVSTDPSANTVLQVAPSTITLTFNETIQVVRHAIRVFDPSGEEQIPQSISSRDAVVTATLDPLTESGTYTVGWEVVSADGHDVKGGYVFHLRTRTASAPAHIEASASRAPLALRALGSALLISALVAAMVIPRARRDRSSARAAWLVACVGSLAAALGTTESIGSSISEGYQILSANTTGTLLALSLGIAVVGVILARTLLGRPLAAIGIIVASMPGHAIALDPIWRSTSLTAAHVIAAGSWAVGLLWLVATTRGDDDAVTDRAVRRFSPWAMACVAVVAATGSILLVTRTGWHGLFTSGYGLIGVVKIALLLVAIALAARNRWRLTPALSTGGHAGTDPSTGGASARLRRSIQIEVVVLALALVAGTVLAEVSPPVLHPPQAPFLQRAPFGDGQVELMVDPARVGLNQIHVSALQADGTLNTGMLDLAVEVRLSARNIGPITPTVATSAGGHLESSANLGIAGRWSVRITGHVGTFDQLVATFDVAIARCSPPGRGWAIRRPSPVPRATVATCSPRSALTATGPSTWHPTSSGPRSTPPTRSAPGGHGSGASSTTAGWSPGRGGSARSLRRCPTSSASRCTSRASTHRSRLERSSPATSRAPRISPSSRPVTARAKPDWCRVSSRSTACSDRSRRLLVPSSAGDTTGCSTAAATSSCSRRTRDAPRR